MSPWLYYVMAASVSDDASMPSTDLLYLRVHSSIAEPVVNVDGIAFLIRNDQINVAIGHSHVRVELIGLGRRSM